MRSKVKIDINHKGEPVIRVTVPESYKANSTYRQDDDDDVRDKLVQRFVWPADQVKKHTAFDGIASQTLIRRGYPCIMEHFHENDYIIKPLGTDLEDLEMLKKYIDTLIRFEKDKYGSCGSEELTELKHDSEPIENEIKKYIDSIKDRRKPFVSENENDLRGDIEKYIRESKTMDPDLRASMYLNIISRITPQQKFNMIDAGLMPINLEETLKFLDGDSNPDLLSNLERLTKTVKPGKLFADIGHAQKNFKDPVPGVEWKEEYSKIYNE